MWMGALLAAACGWLWLCATARAEGRLRGWRGTLLGGAALLLAVWQTRSSGLGWGTSVALVLDVAMLSLPALSYVQAARRRSAQGAGR